MRVTYILNDATLGGAQTFVSRIARELSGSVQSRLIVLMSSGAMSAEYSSSFDDVKYLDIKQSSWNLPRLRRLVRAEVSNTVPDVVHSNLLQSDLSVLPLLRKPRYALVSTVHSSGYGEKDPLRTRALDYVIAKASNRFDAVVACSDGAAKHMAEVGYVHRGARTIANGVRVPPLEPTKSGRDVLCLARWHPMKGHKILLEAWAAGRGAIRGKLLLAGPGMDDSNVDLRALIDELELWDQVILLGEVLDVAMLLTRTRLLVISSPYGEALPMAGLEALAAGVPVLSTNVGSCGLLVLDPNLLVTPGSVSSLTEALNYYSRLDEHAYAALRIRSWSLAMDNFSLSGAARDYLSLYMEVS